MSTVLITGGTGFVGGRIARKLSVAHNVVASSRTLLAEELLDAHGIRDMVLHHSLLAKGGFPESVDTVIHMAALNEWDCIKYPSAAIRVNIDETRILLENAIAAGVKQFIYFSTAHIYGSPLKGLITESSLPQPIHPYAITHRSAEDYVMAAGLQKKIKAVVIRLSNSFGAPVVPTVNRWTLLANDLAKQAITNNKLILLSNGCQYRDFICLSDVENVISEVVADTGSDNAMIFNLGSGKSMKVIEMAELMAEVYLELFHLQIPVELPRGVSPTDEPMLEYSIERLKEKGWQVRNEFRREIKDLLVFCKTHFSAQ